MSDLVKRILAIAMIFVIVFGWILTVNGIGSIKPIKDQIKQGLDIKGGVYVVLEADSKLTKDKLREVMDQTKTVVENRVDQLGLANPVVTVEGEKRIRVELPGAENATDAINQIGKTAQLKFTLADGSFVLDGGQVKTATTAQDQEKGGYAVDLQFDKTGTEAFAVASKKAFQEVITPTVVDPNTQQKIGKTAIIIWLDDTIISAPEVNEPITGGRCQITGKFTESEATNLSALIRGGALPVPLKEVTSSTQTAKIGLNALEQSIYAGLIGVGIILLIMFIGYRIMGLAANIALSLYIVILIAAMALMGSVLTLPGIAGVILSIGMAVDANVIIFSRIRDELADGRSIRAATKVGYKRAMSTVIDSQVTTLIAAVILYQVGTSAVKGFAWTLMLGIIASLFTAMVVTQLYLDVFSGMKLFAKKAFYGVREDNTVMFKLKKQFKIVKYRKIFYLISIGVIAIGLVFGLVRGLNFGIDFTGGTMIHVDLEKHVAPKEISTILDKYNVDAEIVYTGDKQNEVIIRTVSDLENKERDAILEDMYTKYNITEDNVLATELFGPSIGKELRDNAIKAVLIAAIGMLLYIRLRFAQWKFGAAALVGVAHDVLIVLAFYAVFNITVNNPFIAGILTVVGYSINDTIVIFDRLRENLKVVRTKNTEEIIDDSINQTLSRSLMTSATTIVVMIPLYIMAPTAIKEFVLPLMVGVFVGALSSIFVASPIFYELSKRDNHSEYEKNQKKLQKEKMKKQKEKEK
ncbi:MAG: protein translocase subunit SecD, partial [Anaerovoracaceae bacterium]